MREKRGRRGEEKIDIIIDTIIFRLDTIFAAFIYAGWAVIWLWEFAISVPRGIRKARSKMESIFSDLLNVFLKRPKKK